MSDLAKENKNRILIVDDDPEFLDLMRKYLDDDYIVGTIAYGKFAVDYIREYPTDLVIMDIMMPTMDGFETLNNIRKSEEGAGIPVIFITGKSTRNTVLDSINVGVDAYLLKPINKQMLTDKIEEILRIKNSMTLKKTILAVDDDVTYLKIINNSLKDVFNVIMLNSVALANSYLSNHKPDVIILDYQMAENGGTILLNSIKNNPEFKEVPVIMMAGLDDKTIATGDMTAKPNRFLIKPISKLDLMRIIISSLNDFGKNIRPE